MNRKTWIVMLGTAALCMGASIDEGLKLLARRDYSGALAQLEVAVASEPDNLRFGSEYRQAVIQAGAYERCLKFFQKLASDHPQSAVAHLNYGFAMVDKIPAAGAITQVILANNALAEFSRSLEIAPTWLAYYTRGSSYLYWPKIFKKAPLGVADLEQAMKLQRAGNRRPYYVRTYIALGDGYWKSDEIGKAKAVWAEGLKEFPRQQALEARLAKSGDDLKAYIDDCLDTNKRVDTNLREIWESGQ